MNRRLLAASLAAVLAPIASADVITGKYSGQYSKNVTIQTPTYNGGASGSVPTVTFNWQRTDSPGPGVDNLIANEFVTYCVDLGQSVSSGTNHTYDVLTTAQAGYSQGVSDRLGRLWSSFQGDVNNATESAAFQTAIWEVLLDTDGDVSTGLFKASSPSSVTNQAQAWVDAVMDANYSGGTAELRVLHSQSVQDQITVVPAPGFAFLFCAGLLAAKRRGRATT